MTVYYDKELSPGEYVWNITFTTSLFSDDKDLFETSITNGKESGLLLGSPSQKIGARRIFPCWDQPNFKAKFEIRLKHLNKHVVSSNMAIEWEYASPNETITEFVLTPRISPFFFTIMICNISRIPAEDITLQRRQQVASYLNYAEIMIRNVILHIESQWNGCRLTRFEKMDHVAFPDLRQEFMRIMGFTLYRETALIYDEKLDSIMHKINMARLVGYAFAHQCFNKPENFQPWPRVWLTEGILILLTVEEINKLYPDLQIMDLFVVQIQQESLRLDTDSIIVPLAKSTRINQGSPYPYYVKAPVILRILQHTIGQELFWKIIRRLLNNTKYNTWLILDDFWETLPVLGYIYDSYLSVQNMLTSWIKLRHYPVLKVLQYNRSHVTVIMDNTLGNMIHIRNILLSLLESINAFTVKMYEKPNNLSSCLIQEAAKWACVLGHSKCQRTATSILSQHLNSSTRVSPIWKKWTYCNGILFNSSDIWWNVFTLWIKTRDSQLLDYLSCTRNSSIVHDYLQLNMLIRKGNILGYVDYTSGFKKVQRIDHVNSFLFTIVRHAKDDIVLEYMLKNFTIIIPSDITWYAALISIVSHVQSDKQLDKVYEVLNKFPNFMIYLPILIVKQAIDIRLFEIENQLNYFRCFVRK
ncbi:PREDICTED: aminopeptidase M1-C-like [Vollenhovia emeryi]|uniref:aminopeptidase M1-C-like n=1 Tax=Vollenhovia emeryi TaxID=411798 RepID=UPI0005F3828B|nr:PREDICTED: aminopeptidase M1-C-like [Vollenhovia emeryi]